MRALILLSVCFYFFVILSTHAQIERQEFCSILSGVHAEQAEYVPNVDVHGNALVPVDVGTSLQAAQSPILLPVNIDVAEYMGPDLSPKLEDAENLEVTPALIAVYNDGSVEYNGQDISDKSDVYCGDFADQREEPFYIGVIEGGNADNTEDSIVGGYIIEGTSK